ncbi:MAG: hypothetical protein FWE04_03345 [Oscillospiraceae bacterium]|nr:hypothetical protein [Oscillospiraceae bacterium]
MKNFAKNFGISLLGYFIISLLAIIIGQPIHPDTYLAIYWRFFGFNMTTILIILHMIIIAALYFFLGTKLNLLSKHWLNYLSVCGGLVIAIIFLLHPYLGMIFNASFAWLLYLGRGNTWFYRMSIVIAFLPSIFTWLGMLYHSRKLKKKQSETTD